MCDQQSLRSACAYAQSDQSLCKSLEYSMTVKLPTEHHLEFLSLKGGCTGLDESTLVKCHIVGILMRRLISNKNRNTSHWYHFTLLKIYMVNIRGTFGKFLEWSCISETDLQILSCLISFFLYVMAQISRSYYNADTKQNIVNTCTAWFKHILFVYFVHRTTYKDIQY